MAKGPSGRVVIVLEPTLKQELYVELVRRGLTLKEWFIGQATDFLDASRQPPLFVAENLDHRDQYVSPGIPSSSEEDNE